MGQTDGWGMTIIAFSAEFRFRADVTGKKSQSDAMLPAMKMEEETTSQGVCPAFRGCEDKDTDS